MKRNTHQGNLTGNYRYAIHNLIEGKASRNAEALRKIKLPSSRPGVFIFMIALILFSSCEHDISVSTALHPDGSLDRTIVLYERDSGNAENNIFGINKARGWDIAMKPSTETPVEADQKTKLDITFKKSFASVEEANDEMNPSADTAFHIEASFEKQNRWFYTYIEYRDTYKALNLFNRIPKEQYFTKEDFAFIDRLPAEGTPIGKADSLYLARLNEKIFDVYGTRTIFEEFFEQLMSTMQEHGVALQWQDSLIRNKEKVYNHFIEVGNLDDGDFVDVVSNLNVPLSPATKEAIRQNTAVIEKRLEFLSEAYSGKYVHKIEAPWTVIHSNADSAVANQLFWRPPVLKFLLSDYTMSVTARKMNVGAVVISGIIVLATIVLFFRKRERA